MAGRKMPTGPALERLRRRCCALLKWVAVGQRWAVKHTPDMRRRKLGGAVVRIDFVYRATDPACAVVYVSTLEPRAAFGGPLAPSPPPTSGITVPIGDLKAVVDSHPVDRHPAPRRQ